LISVESSRTARLMGTGAGTSGNGTGSGKGGRKTSGGGGGGGSPSIVSQPARPANTTRKRLIASATARKRPGSPPTAPPGPLCDVLGVQDRFAAAPVKFSQVSPPRRVRLLLHVVGSVLLLLHFYQAYGISFAVGRVGGTERGERTHDTATDTGTQHHTHMSRRRAAHSACPQLFLSL
jgi:hypothetical protein